MLRLLSVGLNEFHSRKILVTASQDFKLQFISYCGGGSGLSCPNGASKCETDIGRDNEVYIDEYI